eukprot:RCo042720
MASQLSWNATSCRSEGMSEVELSTSRGRNGIPCSRQWHPSATVGGSYTSFPRVEDAPWSIIKLEGRSESSMILPQKTLMSALGRGATASRNASREGTPRDWFTTSSTRNWEARRGRGVLFGATSEPSRVGSYSSLTIGVVIAVVTTAIRTITVKICVLMTPLESPTFSTTSSTSPLVFISTASVSAVRVVSPQSFAVTKHPVSFPVHAVAMTSTSIPTAIALFRLPTFVLMPETAKYVGSQRCTIKSSSLSVRAWVKPSSLGRMIPATKPPNMAWMPIISVNIAEPRASSSTPSTAEAAIGSWLPDFMIAHRAMGRTNKNIISTNTAASNSVYKAMSGVPPELISATVSARRTQAVTSSTAAADIVICPTGVWINFRSVKIRASTGKAVMLIATPKNSTKVLYRDNPSPSWVYKAYEEAAPKPKGTAMPLIEIIAACFPVFRKEAGFSSIPTRNRKKMSPMFAKFVS